MIGGFVANAINTALDGAPFMQTETFESPNGVAPAPARLALVSFLTVLVIFAVMLFVGKWLWNNVAVNLFTVVKPVKSVWQLVGLALLVSLFHPGSCNCA